MTKLSVVLTMMMGVFGQEGPLVSAGWLAGQLGKADVVVLHVGTEKDYAEGHIAGARLLRLTDITVTDAQGLRMQLPDAFVHSLQHARSIANRLIILNPAVGRTKPWICPKSAKSWKRSPCHPLRKCTADGNSNRSS